MAKKKPAATMGIADRIRSVIESRGLTPYAVSKAAGLDPSVLCRFLARERTLSLESAERLFTCLDLRVEEGRGGLRR